MHNLKFRKDIKKVLSSLLIAPLLQDILRRTSNPVHLFYSWQSRNYTGGDLISTEIDGTTFLCIKGDFFKVICTGDLSFLQKSSDASGKPSYNGTEVVFSNGTEGSPNDYFIYDNRNKQLQLVSRKNFSEVIAATFADYTAAIDKAKTTSSDIAQLKDAVEFYNRRNSK
jgi:hypothetical protein